MTCSDRGRGAGASCRGSAGASWPAALLVEMVLATWLFSDRRCGRALLRLAERVATACSTRISGSETMPESETDASSCSIQAAH